MCVFCKPSRSVATGPTAWQAGRQQAGWLVRSSSHLLVLSPTLLQRAALQHSTSAQCNSSSSNSMPGWSRKQPAAAHSLLRL